VNAHATKADLRAITDEQAGWSTGASIGMRSPAPNSKHLQAVVGFATGGGLGPALFSVLAIFSSAGTRIASARGRATPMSP